MDGDPIQLIEEEERKLGNIRGALLSIKFSFFCFVVFLIESLTYDIWEERYDLIHDINSYKEIIDVSISGGSLAFGIVLISIGAYKMGKDIN